MAKKIAFTTTISKNQFGQRLDKALTILLPNCSRSSIKKWILDYRVLVNGVFCNKPKRKVTGGENIIINSSFIKENFIPKAQDIPLDILYEDNDIIIINKSCNMVVHPGAGNPDKTIFNALLQYYPPLINIPRAGIVHRLDKDTTGLMVIAKTILAQEFLVKSFQLHKVIREYEAIVTGCIMDNGTIKEPIRRHPIKRNKMFVHPEGKPAITHYSIIERFRMHTRLRLQLETGRTHQIRVHMAYITHPLIGDKLYNNRRFQYLKETSKTYNITLRNFNRQALHATTLRFRHPIDGAKMEWYSPIPKDMKNLVEIMRIDIAEKDKTNKNH